LSFGIILIVLSIIWLLSEIILARVKHSQSTDKTFDRSSLRLLWTAILMSVSLGVYVGSHHVGYFGEQSRAVPITGIVLIALGLLLRWIAIITLKHQFSVDVAIKKNHYIVRTGIYRFVRHPAYAGSLLSFLGLGLSFSNYLTILIIFVPICFAFLYRINVEEKALTAAFGDEYINYCASTKKLIPGIF
jgi:protein-S-isoprenylcysteine O-methyltransferase Ste14